MDKFAVIVAGGSGARMKSNIPKQFLQLDGRPILMHTLQQFAKASVEINIILVLPANEITFWENLVKEFNFLIPHKLVMGGVTRVESVRNGLATVPDGTLVAVHDGVRPLVSQKLIHNCYKSALKNGSGVAALPSKDSIRKIDSHGNYNVTRADYRLMQTPQTFQTDKLKLAFENYTGEEATDDATIAEKNGLAIELVPGEYTNIKITTPEDLVIAQALLDNKLVS